MARRVHGLVHGTSPQHGDQFIELLKDARYRDQLSIDVVSGDFGHDDPLTEEAYEVGQRLRDEGGSGVALAVRIPLEYLGAQKAIRIRLIQGILGADHGSFYASSPEFARDVAELVRSVGGWCSVTHHKVVGEVAVEYQPLGPRAYRSARSFLLRASPRPSASRSRTLRASTSCDYVVTHNTSLALNIAENVALELKLPVLVFSMEMGGTQLATRLLGSVGKVDAQKLRTGRLEPDDWDRLGTALGKLNEAPILIDETAALNPLELRARARRKWREYGGLGLIVIDYIQLMQASDGEQENRATELSEISRGLKAMAKELKVPGDRALAAEPLARAAAQQAPGDVGPARVGRHRAGRRHDLLHLPRRGLQRGLARQGHRGDHHRQAA